PGDAVATVLLPGALRNDCPTTARPADVTAARPQLAAAGQPGAFRDASVRHNASGGYDASHGHNASGRTAAAYRTGAPVRAAGSGHHASRAGLPGERRGRRGCRRVVPSRQGVGDGRTARALRRPVAVYSSGVGLGRTVQGHTDSAQVTAI